MKFRLHFRGTGVRKNNFNFFISNAFCFIQANRGNTKSYNPYKMNTKIIKEIIN
jgi:hypothetical protein